ncbi:hypothetical protein CONPUDRAFT_162732 [Coniophora puteana RWD-64-598 SS2]|uniref:Uncharacterized protein n=1 Tax=Coniophora puteana (strain RWD-64-598) TaxID=741705 RepID=A0A5M3N2E9_CONPW|nr:uncharacterized protein CONPUDRAFT_162732 [Coniophora puteana RWD-64-598 SS2]EIW85560.1 hypothetical protein CONPUDRAFT_162732 [Coniophora puteana RWD-64-598 SS2]
MEPFPFGRQASLPETIRRGRGTRRSKHPYPASVDLATELRNAWAPFDLFSSERRRTTTMMDPHSPLLNPLARSGTDSRVAERHSGNSVLPPTHGRASDQAQERPKKRVKIGNVDDEDNVTGAKVANPGSVPSSSSSFRPREPVSATAQTTRPSASSSRSQVPKPSVVTAPPQGSAPWSGAGTPVQAIQLSKPPQKPLVQYNHLNSGSGTSSKPVPPSANATLLRTVQDKDTKGQPVASSSSIGETSSQSSLVGSVPSAPAIASTSSQPAASVAQSIGVSPLQPPPPPSIQSPIASPSGERPAEPATPIKREDNAFAKAATLQAATNREDDPVQRAILQAETDSLMQKYERVMDEQKMLKEKLEARIAGEEKRNEQLKRLLDEA